MPIDMSAAKAPPRRGAPRKATPAGITPAKSVTDARREGLDGLAQLAQAGLLIVQQYADAAAISQHMPGINRELAAIAESNDAIAKPIDMLISVGPYGGLVAAILPFAMQIAANHGWIKADQAMGGVVPPQVLESQMKANIARMQADAARAQQEAVREAQQAEAEYRQMMADAA